MLLYFIWTTQASLLLFVQVVSILVREPTDVFAVRNSTVILQCYTNLSVPVSWEIERAGDGINWEHFYKGYGDIPGIYQYKYNVSADPTRGQYNLTIGNVEPEDSGTYRCGDNLGLGLKKYKEGVPGNGATAELVVIVNDEIECRQESNFNQETTGPNYIGLIKINCNMTYRGNKSPNFQWSLRTRETDVSGISLQSYSNSTTTSDGADSKLESELSLDASTVPDQSYIRFEAMGGGETLLTWISEKIIKPTLVQDSTPSTAGQDSTALTALLAIGVVVICLGIVISAMVLYIYYPRWMGCAKLKRRRVSEITHLETIPLRPTQNPGQIEEVVIPPNQAPRVRLTCLAKENIGYGAATGYFYDFLRLVLPDFRSRFRDATISDYAAVPGMLNETVLKMLIILPLSCFCPTEIKDGNRIENVKDLFVKRWANRAGDVKRDFKSSVFKLTDQNSRKEYYFAGGFATPLLTMYETYSDELVGMTLDQLYRERDIFCSTLHQILQHPKNKECNNQYRIIMWDDGKDINGDFKTPLYNLLLPILKEELAKEKREQELASANLSMSESDTETSRKNNAAVIDISRTLELIDVENQSMTAIYERSQFKIYPLRNGVRGKALIINIINYDVYSGTAAALLPTRTGADKDEAKMEKLFRDLGFETATHQDVSMRTLEEVLMSYSGTVNHTDCDAFICCIMTHGNLGEIFTSDGLPYRILDVVDMFSSTKCKSLHGKPKLFFVESCQQRITDSDSSENNQFLTPERRALLVPGEPDILISYSALPGSISYSYPQHGSLYIDALATNLRKDLEINRALKRVTEDVTNKLEEQNQTTNAAQLPFHLTTGMSKMLYLTPIKPEEV